MDALGVTAADLVGEVAVWPENVEIVAIFRDMGTQWNVGFNGRTGLQYPAIFVPLRLRRIPRDRWEGIWDGVRIMERAVLEMQADAHG